MIVALYILFALIAAGIILRLLHRPGTEEPSPQPAADLECCGQHTVCEKNSLLLTGSEDTLYFDDEELDRFRGRSPEQYTTTEIDEFRTVLITLLPSDVIPWSKSIRLRGVELPTEIRDELLMIIDDIRTKSS